MLQPRTFRWSLTLSSQHRPEIVEAALDDCLQELGLDYLDVCIPICLSRGKS